MKHVFTSLFFLSLLAMLCPADSTAQKLYYDYRDAGGDWETQEIGNRFALRAERDDQMGFIDITIPEDGFYQLYASLLHTWDQKWPGIEITILQNGLLTDTGYLSGEPGELSHQDGGRWLFKSLSRGNLFRLTKGKARIEFRLSARNNIRKEQTSTVEKELFLDAFLIIPGNEQTGVMNILEAERATGEWETIEHNPKERCGTVESMGDGPATFNFFIPSPAIYTLFASLRNTGETTMKMVGVKTASINLNKDDHWKNQHLFTTRLAAGPATISLQNVGANKIVIDSFFMAPFLETDSHNTLSCSTVYFYHNQKAANLQDSLKRIAAAGFRFVDIVAYDDKYGINEQTSEDELYQIKELLHRLDLTVSSIHFGVIPLHSIDEAMQKITWAIRLAKLFEAKIIVAPPTLEIDDDILLTTTQGQKMLAGIISAVKPELEKNNISLGLENHSGSKWLLQTSADFLMIRTALSRNVFFIPDEDHFRLAGEDPIAAIDTLARYSPFLHFKTNRVGYLNKLKNILETNGWNGHISLEIEQTGISLKGMNSLYRNKLAD